MKTLWITLLLFFAGHLAAQEGYKKTIKQHRNYYRYEFLQNPNTPLDRRGIKKIRFFKADTLYRVEATLTLLENQESFDMPTLNGGKKEFIKYALATFEIQGDTLELVIYQSMRSLQLPQFRNSLFLPFKDMTNEVESYGGGRYLDLSAKNIKNNKIILDFNKAYNPYCAYKTGWSCPIPPKENHLELGILAGEKIYWEEKSQKETPIKSEIKRKPSEITSRRP